MTLTFELALEGQPTHLHGHCLAHILYYSFKIHLSDIICSLKIQAPRKLIDSGCGSSAEQVAMNELEKLLVAHTRYEKCQWLIKPRLNGKTPSYPVIRLAQGVTPSLVF